MSYIVFVLSCILFVLKVLFFCFIVLIPFVVGYYLVRFLILKLEKAKDIKDSERDSYNQRHKYEMFFSYTELGFLRDRASRNNKYFSYYTQLFLAFIIWVLFFSNILYVGDTVVIKDRYEKSLYAFEDSQGFYIRGGVFSTSGADKLVYYYTVKEGGQSFKSYRAEARRSKITYSKESPKVIYYTSQRSFVTDKWYEGIYNKLFKKDSYALCKDTYFVEFFVPDGSVQNSYNSDLK